MLPHLGKGDQIQEHNGGVWMVVCNWMLLGLEALRNVRRQHIQQQVVADLFLLSQQLLGLLGGSDIPHKAVQKHLALNTDEGEGSRCRKRAS